MEDLQITSPEAPTLAKYACDYCRTKKLRCSRELPKCSNCKQWPGGCEYSHAVHKKKRDGDTPGDNNGLSKLIETVVLDQVQGRFDRIDSTVGELQKSITHLSRLVESNVRTNNGHVQQSQVQTRHSVKNSATYLNTHSDPMQGFSKFSQTSLDLETLMSEMPSVPAHLNGSSSLKDLSEALESIHFESDEVRENVRRAGRSGCLFYIPSNEIGEQLIPRFLHIIRLGTPLYLPPSRELLSKIVFDPSIVSERGWVLLFNCLLLNTIPRTTSDPEMYALRARLRWNTWLALDDSSLFLEPCNINIISLLTIASHGEDFVTPNLSWILVGHACRLAQAMNLHLPSSNSNPDIENQRIFLFWSLFSVDKSVSLAFGRPDILAAPFYEHVPLPNTELLTKFRPHITSTSDATSDSRFGSNFFLQTIALAKLRRRILDFIQSLAFLDYSVRQETKIGLKTALQEWYAETKQLLTIESENESGYLSEDGRRELELGMRSMIFQYHHLYVCLTRYDETELQSCLQASREALLTLEGLESSSARVYNGITWQLLYYPFIPFFVLFGNIIRAPLTTSCISDIQLLFATESYLHRMTSLGNVASKLETIAHVFSLLAEMYVREVTEKSQKQGPTSVQYQDSCNTETQMSTPWDDLDMNALFEGQNIDAGEILGWLSTTEVKQKDDYRSTGDSSNIVYPTDVFTSPVYRGVKRPLEYNFDWFAWDTSRR